MKDLLQFNKITEITFYEGAKSIWNILQSSEVSRQMFRLVSRCIILPLGEKINDSLGANLTEISSN